MSTHTHTYPETRPASPPEATAEPCPETRPASPPEATAEPCPETEPAADDDLVATSPFDDHNAAATFDTGHTVRLPNTVDGENKRVG